MAKSQEVLWIIDIDGTIINVHKNQIPAWNKALNESYGFTPDEDVLISYFGKPFKSVLFGIAKHYDVDEEKIKNEYDKALEIYTTSVSDYLKETGGEILPGAVKFLEELGGMGIKKAIATGNPEYEGSFKLEYFDLLKYFEITVYCEERDERIEMVQEAIRQGEERYGIDLKNNPKRVVIIGDSVHDIESAHQVGGTGVAVTSGQTSQEVLSSKHPDFIFDGVRDYRKVIEDVMNSID